MAENEVITTNYIYLLQLREFVKTKENVYKVGRTTQENHKRFAQYPKGSVLLFQMICNDCVRIEKDVLEKFRQNFKQRKDLGNEYFEGDYRNMIDIIYLTVKSSSGEVTKEEKKEYKDDKKLKINDATPIDQITTYKEWIKYSGVSKIIVINDIDNTGENIKRYYLKPKGEPWVFFKNLYDLCCSIEQNKKGGTSLDIAKLSKNILDVCYTNEYEFYNMPRHEYIVIRKCPSSGTEYGIFNAINISFTPIDEVIGDKILTVENCSFMPLIITKDITNIDITIVEGLLKSLISDDMLIQFKKLMYNLLVKCEEKQIVFYDYNECLLTTCMEYLLPSIIGNNSGITFKWHGESDNWAEFNCTGLRYVKIVKEFSSDVPMEKQLKCFRNFNCNVIILTDYNNTKKIYNISEYKKYVNNNKEIIKTYLDRSGALYLPLEDGIYMSDRLLYDRYMLQANFLKWCCTKSP